jgi:hypothetical protein
MSFQSVWGFDPDEVTRAQKLGSLEPNVGDCDSGSADQLPPSMPLDIYVQIYELRRIFGL